MGGVIYTINQDSRGFIWLGTGSGISIFDGKDFYNIPLPDSTSNAFAVSSLTLENGSIVYGLSDGTACISEGSTLKQIQGIGAIRINDIISGAGENLLLLSQNKGIYSYNPGTNTEPIKLASTSDELLFSGVMISESEIFLGTNRGLIKASINNDEIVQDFEVEALAYRKIQSVISFPSRNKYMVGTEDDGVYIVDLESESPKVERLFQDEEWSRMRVRSLEFDNNGDLWIASINDGVLKVRINSETNEIIEFTTFTTETGLAGNNAHSLYFDREGNTWIGLFGNGISVLASDAYSLILPGEGDKANNIVALFELNSVLFAGSDRGYYLYDLDKKESKDFIDLSRFIGTARITSFSAYKDGAILFGTDINGAYIRQSNGKVSALISSLDNLEKQVSSIAYDGNYIWIATRGGVISLKEPGGDLIKYTNFDGLPHNSINEVLPDGMGKVYIAAQSNKLYTIDPELDISDAVSSGKAVIWGGGRTEFYSFDIARDGSVWGATDGSGIFLFRGDSSINFSEEDGLLNRFCKSILVDSRNNVWVGHSTGFSVYDSSLEQIRTFKDIFKTEAGSNDRAIYETESGLVLMGMQEGFMKYDPELDQSRLIPPSTSIISVTIGDDEYPYRESFTLPYKPRYNITIKYAGLYYSDPDKVYYKYKLDNYDNEWSDSFSGRELEFRLSDGEYRFNIISYNYDGITDNQISGFDILIKKPIWRLWWFIGLLILAAGVIIVIVVRIRERAQIKVKEYLESELKERTKEVVKQKEEIEFQNREITDSINYAQRIQAGLLPATTKLEEAFNGAFTFYRPRDIVSGDFYWFDQVSDDRFVLVCADSTGHGVPGAFMSMIGSALIQEIVLRKEVTRPSQILSTLDREISSTLNQGEGENSTSDGMDIVVCEFNLKTRLFRFASAMRPVIVVMDGEQYYIRGNKNSVGGEMVSEKYFDDQEYFLKKGDSVYLFSDGYPDQFGGPMGKKLKILRLKNLVDEIKVLPMDQQFSVVSDFFDEWKGDLEQVDDVLFMGVQV